MSTMTQSIISQLANLISTSVATIEKLCQDNQLTIPDLNSPGFDPQSEAFRSNAAVAEAAKVASAACMQLAASLLPPTDVMFQLTVGDHRSAAVGVCLEANVTEILREAGPGGLHVDDIAKECGLDPSKLGRIMRYLAIHHVYRELKPDVFTNNRISGTLDTGKATKDILADPESKYDSSGFAALCSNHVDIDFKCSAIAWDVLNDPDTGHSNEITQAIFCRALKTDLSFWDFFEHPDNRFHHRRFGFVMQGLAAIQPKDVIFKAFDWDSLPKGSLVVDVGGGIGIATMPLARKYPELNIVIQDLPKAIEEAKRFWSSESPEALKDDRVRFEVHDFFTPQPIKNASVFIVKQILHDWPDQYISKLLSELRGAAVQDTVLIIIDNILPYACRVPDDRRRDLEYINFHEAPEPLLPNYGAVSNGPYSLDISMMFLYNAQEHTILQLKQLLASTGWRLTKSHSIDPKNYFMQSVEAVPM